MGWLGWFVGWLAVVVVVMVGILRVDKDMRSVSHASFSPIIMVLLEKIKLNQ